MTLGEFRERTKGMSDDLELENDFTDDYINAVKMGIKALEFLEQEFCKMTAEEYRQRMMQAFHKTDCDELIALCVPPTEKEFEHLEWLLKNHYKKEHQVATNGDMIKAMFPDLDVEIEGDYVTCWIDEHRWIGFDLSWWNVPYRR